MELIKNRNAQFMLLAGFIIASGLVITTILLNSLIFEVNTAEGGGSDPSKNDIINLMQITRDGIRIAYERSTIIGGNMEYNFSLQMNNFNWNLSKVYALYGKGVNISWDVSNWNSNSYANFTSNGRPDGETNWTVVEGVNPGAVSSSYSFNFSKITFTGTSFKIEARNSTNDTVWYVEFSNPNQYTVSNITYTTSGAFDPDTGVELRNPPFNFTGVSSNPVSLHIINGRNAYGRFKIKGNANGKVFYRERDYIFNATVTLSSSKMHANITIPVSVPK